jgi:hypothetical protein
LNDDNGLNECEIGAICKEKIAGLEKQTLKIYNSIKRGGLS